MIPKNLLLATIVALALVAGSVRSAAPAELPAAPAAFTAIALGTSGGLDEDNLSSYLLAPNGSTEFVALDAGTLMVGLRRANALGSLAGMGQPADSNLIPEAFVLQQRIKAYLISHAHLDHVMGLVINSPDDRSKDILGTDATIDAIRDHLFNWRTWPGFGNEGAGFNLKKYRYVRLAPGVPAPIAGTAMTVESLPLSHGGVASTAFLVGAGPYYAAYFGDTGPDAVEKSGALQAAWARLAPLVRANTLRGLFIEVSYPDGRPDKLLFGHLTPEWLMRELGSFAATVDPSRPSRALFGITVFITHVKPALERGEDPVRRIARELEARNDLGLRFVFLNQGQRFDF